MNIVLGEKIFIQKGNKKKYYIVHNVFDSQIQLQPINPNNKWIIIEKVILPQTVRPYRLDFKTRKPI